MTYEPHTTEERSGTLPVSRIAIGASLGLIAAALSVLILTVTGEIYVPLKDWLKVTFSHHWVGKGVVASGSFVLFTLVSSLLPPREGVMYWILLAAAWITLISAVGIIAFFGYEAFVH